jgi:hypothetical protein
MDFWIGFFELIPWYGYFASLGLLCGVYFLCINPLFFHFWIIPRIENRYGAVLKINPDDYYAPFANWGMPPLEVSGYIVCKYINWELPGVKKPWKKTLTCKLKVINYDINQASKAEIVMSFITISSMLCFFISGTIVAIAK